jgi:hypothetical protein
MKLHRPYFYVFDYGYFAIKVFTTEEPYSATVIPDIDSKEKAVAITEALNYAFLVGQAYAENKLQSPEELLNG